MGIGDIPKGAINTSLCEARIPGPSPVLKTREKSRTNCLGLEPLVIQWSTWLPITLLLPLTTRITNLRRHHLEQRPRWLDRCTSNIYPANRSWLRTLLRCTLNPRTMRSERSSLLDFLKMSRHGKYTISSASFPVMNPLIFVPTLAHRCFSNFI